MSVPQASALACITEGQRGHRPTLNGNQLAWEAGTISGSFCVFSLAGNAGIG